MENKNLKSEGKNKSISQEERQSLIEIAKEKLNTLSDEQLEDLAGGIAAPDGSCIKQSCNTQQ